MKKLFIELLQHSIFVIEQNRTKPTIYLPIYVDPVSSLQDSSFYSFQPESQCDPKLPPNLIFYPPCTTYT